MKKIIALLAALMLLVTTLAGCGPKEYAFEDPTTYPEDPYEINWYMRATPQQDVESVEAEVNKILTKEINATLKIHMLDTAQYAKLMSTKVSAGDYFDLAFSSGTVLGYGDYTKQGAFFNCEPYVDDYMPDVKALFPEEFWEAGLVTDLATNEKELRGGVPIYKELAGYYAWVYRKDVADKLGINMDDYKTLEELEPVLEKIKANPEFGIEYPMEWDTSSVPQNVIHYGMTCTDGVVYWNEDGSGFKDGKAKVEIFPDSAEFRQLCETTHRFWEKGLVKPDVMTDSNARARLENGESFCIVAPMKPGGVEEMFPNAKFEFAQSRFSPIQFSKYTSSTLAISNTSKNPARVMRFLNLLYTNAELSNLLVHGIEGKHYTKEADGRIKVVENGGYSLADKAWMMGNVTLNYLTTADPIDKYEQFRTLNEQAVNSPMKGFAPDLTEFELEKVQLNAVKNQYRNQAVLGALDPKEICDEYSAKLKEAGIERVIAAVQEQLDAYLAENNK